MQEKFISFVDGIYVWLPKKTPFAMVQSVVMSVIFFAQNLEANYAIDMQNPDLAGQLQKHFNEEVIEDVGGYLYSVEQFEKRCKKNKRINQKMQEMSKEVLMAMVLGVMSVHTFEKDGVI